MMKLLVLSLMLVALSDAFIAHRLTSMNRPLQRCFSCPHKPRMPALKCNPENSPALSENFDSTFRKEGTRWGSKADAISAADDAPAPLDVVTKSIAQALVTVLKGTLDWYYSNKSDFARFFVLETVARVPYFAYMSVLHLYESLGYHDRAHWIKIHYAEADNELHHLLIMEALGGNKEFSDRWLAQHAAFAYYWFCVAFYIIHPRGAYYVMSLIEDHAFHTYAKYIEANKGWLSTQPSPAIARQYYEGGDLYLFDAFHTTRAEEQERRPSVSSLLDTFQCIRDDERQHQRTMLSLVERGRP